jgi:hypothetical protein
MVVFADAVDEVENYRGEKDEEELDAEYGKVREGKFSLVWRREEEV